MGLLLTTWLRSEQQAGLPDERLLQMLPEVKEKTSGEDHGCGGHSAPRGLLNSSLPRESTGGKTVKEHQSRARSRRTSAAVIPAGQGPGNPARLQASVEAGGKVNFTGEFLFHICVSSGFPGANNVIRTLL